MYRKILEELKKLGKRPDEVDIDVYAFTRYGEPRHLVSIHDRNEEIDLLAPPPRALRVFVPDELPGEADKNLLLFPPRRWRGA